LYLLYYYYYYYYYKIIILINYYYKIIILSDCNIKNFTVVSECATDGCLFITSFAKAEKDRQCTYYITLRHVRETTVAVEKQ